MSTPPISAFIKLNFSRSVCSPANRERLQVFTSQQDETTSHVVRANLLTAFYSDESPTSITGTTPPSSPNPMRKTPTIAKKLTEQSKSQQKSLLFDYAAFLDKFDPANQAQWPEDNLLPILSGAYRASSWAYWIKVLVKLGKPDLAARLYVRLEKSEWTEAAANKLRTECEMEMSDCENEMAGWTRIIEDAKAYKKVLEQELSKIPDPEKDEKYSSLLTEYYQKVQQLIRYQLAYNDYQRKSAEISGYKDAISKYKQLSLQILPTDLIDNYRSNNIDEETLDNDLVDVLSHNN